jgi:hypothetical protein
MIYVICILLEAVGWFIIGFSLSRILYEVTKGAKR